MKIKDKNKKVNREELTETIEKISFLLAELDIRIDDVEERLDKLESKRKSK